MPKGHWPGDNGGGGPRTPEGRARMLANLTGDPRTAAVRHGLRMATGELLRCDGCPVKATCEEFRAGDRCWLEAQYLQDRRAQVLAVGHLSPLDWPAVDALLWCEVRIQRAARALGAQGELLPGGDSGFLELQPLVVAATALVGTWGNLLSKLSPTPEARRALEQANGGPGAALAAAIRQLAEGGRVCGAPGRAGGDGVSSPMRRAQLTRERSHGTRSSVPLAPVAGRRCSGDGGACRGWVKSGEKCGLCGYQQPAQGAVDAAGGKAGAEAPCGSPRVR